MNLNLKAVYYCATAGQRWGKGYTIEEAKKNAGIILKSQEKTAKYFVTAALFNNPTDEELKNLWACIRGNSIDGSVEYYQDDRSDEDTELINRLHVGWLTVHRNNMK